MVAFENNNKKDRRIGEGEMIIFIFPVIAFVIDAAGKESTRGRGALSFFSATCRRQPTNLIILRE